METSIIKMILSLPPVGLFEIPNPSEDNPDNALFHQMKKKGMLIVKGTEENGIWAIGLTAYGQKLQKDLRKGNSFS